MASGKPKTEFEQFTKFVDRILAILAAALLTTALLGCADDAKEREQVQRLVTACDQGKQAECIQLQAYYQWKQEYGDALIHAVDSMREQSFEANQKITSGW